MNEVAERCSRTWRLRHAGIVASLAVVIGVVVIGVGGCGSLNDDLKDLSGGLFMPSPSEAALMAADEFDPDKRREGTLLLSNAPFGGDPQYVELYRLRCEIETDPLVLSVAIRALAKHGSAEDAMIIVPHLQNENQQVRWESAKGLQRLHNPEAVEPLLDVLRNPGEDTDVRLAAAIALGQYREDRVFQGLVGALTVRELSVNLGASASLETMTGKSFGLDPRKWLTWYDEHPNDAFAGGKDFLYPTYHRKDSLLEKIAFWSERPEEQPAPPAGLSSSSAKRTYDDAETDESAEQSTEDTKTSAAPATTEGARRTYADSAAKDADPPSGQ